MFNNQAASQFHKEFKFLQKKIEEYQKIVIYRHKSPDFDALGAQMGLVQWIKDNYPTKEVHYIGERHRTFMPDLFPYPEELSEDWFRQNEHLAICVDVADTRRISENHISFAKEVVKIDHHPLPVEELRYGNLIIVHPDRPAAAEMIALFCLSRPRKFKFSLTAASYCYVGIVGDTGSFKYQDTDGTTLRIAGSLLDLGVNQNKLTALMDRRDERQMNILKYCLNNYHLSPNGTAYYIIPKEAEEELNMTSDEGNLYINMFRGMKGVRVAAAVSWNEKEQLYRVSLRSASMVINGVANHFDGGGHDYAAGCKIKTLDDLPKLIEELDALKD